MLGQCLFLSFSRCAGRKPSSPSQRRGGNVNSFSRRARRPRFEYHHNNKALLDSPPAHKEGGGAPKGASNQYPRHTGKRHRLPMRGARKRAKIGARSPSGAPPRHFADCSAHLRAALPGITGCEREDPPGASAASTSRTGHSAGRYDARSRPGAECVVPPAGTAPAPPSGAPSRKASLDDSTSEMAFRSTFSDACQGDCHRYEDTPEAQSPRRDASAPGRVLLNSVW